MQYNTSKKHMIEEKLIKIILVQKFNKEKIILRCI